MPTFEDLPQDAEQAREEVANLPVQAEQERDASRYDAPVHAMSGPSAITELESTEDLIMAMADYLRGVEVYFNKKTGMWDKRPAREPILNEAGINLFLQSIQSVSHRNTNLSNLEAERIFTIIDSKSRALAHTLFVDKDKYNIKDEDFAQLTPALINAMQIMEVSLRRAHQGREQNLVFSSVKQSKIETINTEPRQESFWSRLNPFK